MSIVARYNGRCSMCPEPIVKGDTIEWDKATRTSAHIACAREAAKTATPAAPTAKAPVAPAPKAAKVVASATGGHPPTAEQQAALDLFATGESLAIEAGAGTGKTSTLLLLAASTTRRGQYVAFNKAIVSDATAKMPENVNCSTAHSLAFKAVGHQFRARLDSSRRMKSMMIANHLGIDEVKTDAKTISRSFLGGLVMQTIVKFCQSADLAPGTQHVPYIEGIDPMTDGRRTYANNDVVRHAIQPAVRRAWADLMSPSGILPFRHDHYLKAWHLSGPVIGADFILFDEAQDANPVMVAIVAAQTHAQLVWVGDSQQQIYTFTGAVNALADVPAERRAILSQSFRFGPDVADVANGILTRLDAALRLTGFDVIPSTVGEIESPDVVLTRTNARAVETVLRAIEEGKTVALVGGGAEVVRFAKAAQELMTYGVTDHPELACFDSWAEVQAYVEEDEQGGDLRLLVKLIDDFGVEKILAALDNTIREEDADLVVSTAHKSKGREWDHVQLGGDFPDDETKVGAEEWRLLYVACTRAKLRLDMTAVTVLNVSTTTKGAR